ncbi:MAG: hypothetical protein JJU03_05400 [Idiomarina sp.]|nr:hypothetical protein [Idiomarina sp.]
MAWQARTARFGVPLAGLLALLGLTACATQHEEQGVACAAPSLFVTQGQGPTVVATAQGNADLRRLATLEQYGCEIPPVLDQLARMSVSEEEQAQLELAEALLAAGRTELAIDWFERSQSFAGYQRLLQLHAPNEPLADDAAYLRYEVKRAQLQQAFGEEVMWPAVSQAQALFVTTQRSALYADTDLDAPIIEGLTADERVYLLDVVALADGESYWVQAYYPATLALGWIPAETLAEYPADVRARLAELDHHQGRSYAQQLLFTALINGMDLSLLSPLGDSDFFGGAQAQQYNSAALLQRLDQVTAHCSAETQRLEQNLARYLMDEGPPPQAEQAPYSDDMRVALSALTGGSAGQSDATVELRGDLSALAHQYFRIRVQGQVEQRLCHSLPNAAGHPGLATQSCAALSELQACVNRVDGIFAE